MEWCAKHFAQSTETPLARGEWDRRIDILDKDNEVEEILKGEYEGPGMDVMECTEWIKGMARVEGMPETELEVTYERFAAFIKSVKESKSSLPSGRHYGHYKTLQEEEELLRLVFKVVQIALQNRIVLERWKHVHQILFLKDPPAVRIDKFRNIMLIEADLMLIMKEIWASKLAGRVQRDIARRTVC